MNEQDEPDEEEKVVSSDEDEFNAEDTTTTSSMSEDTVVSPASANEHWITVQTKRDLPKPNSSIECIFPGHDSAITCKVISRGGRSTTPNWHFLNILEEDSHEGKCCSFKEVSWRTVDEQPANADLSVSNEDRSSAHEEIFYGSIPNEEQYAIPKLE